MSGVYIGCDPGATGAVAVLHCDSVAVYDMPTVTVRIGKSDKRRVSEPELVALAESLCVLGPALVMVEQVGGLPGQSAPAAFTFGESVAALRVAFRAQRVRVAEVPPAKWKKALGVRDGKDGARAAAMQLFPSCAHLFARVKDDGRAEAALIAEYARRHGGL